MAYELIAAVDLGSNSFRLQVGRIVGNQIYPLDSLKESVRLAAGLTRDKTLDGPSQQRALEALARFGERLRGFDAGCGARRGDQYLARGQERAAVPAAGRGRARFSDRSHRRSRGGAPDLPRRRPYACPIRAASSWSSTSAAAPPNSSSAGTSSRCSWNRSTWAASAYSLRFFPGGRVNKKGMKDAELAARKELQTIVHAYQADRLGGGGRLVGHGQGHRRPARTERLVRRPPASPATDWSSLRGAADPRPATSPDCTLAGLRADRIPVLPGGVAIMSAVFANSVSSA